MLAWATEDRFFKPKFAERLAADIPGSRLEWIEDARTFVSEDQPERLAALIADFDAQAPAEELQPLAAVLRALALDLQVLGPELLLAALPAVKRRVVRGADVDVRRGCAPRGTRRCRPSGWSTARPSPRPGRRRSGRSPLRWRRPARRRSRGRGRRRARAAASSCAHPIRRSEPPGRRRDLDRAAGGDPQDAGHVLADPDVRDLDLDLDRAGVARDHLAPGRARRARPASARCAASSSALKRAMPSSRARSASSWQSAVPSPRPCHSSTTVTAASATVGRRGGRSGRRRRAAPGPRRRRSAPRGRGGRPRSDSAAATRRARRPRS